MPILPGAEPYHHAGGPVGALMCHGFTGSPQSIRQWAEALAEAGLTIALPRLPGHGTRWQDANMTTWDDWYACIEREFLALRERCEAVFVMGLSMGGTLSLRLAEQHGRDLAGVVVVNPSVIGLDPRLKVLPVLQRVLPSLAGIGSDIKKPGVHELAYPRVPLRALYSLRKAWDVVRADLPKVTQPLLLLRSAEDHVVEPESSRLVLARVSSSDVSEIVLPDSYHVATLDNDADRIVAESLAFVRRIRPGVAAG
ncbi:MAG TPA: alpha/beta fold hydrolase [Sporichthya sp.]|nr:alpha/beta fold hydrolase [Sporichthya sp.]